MQLERTHRKYPCEEEENKSILNINLIESKHDRMTFNENLYLKYSHLLPPTSIKDMTSFLI